MEIISILISLLPAIFLLIFIISTREKIKALKSRLDNQISKSTEIDKCDTEHEIDILLKELKNAENAYQFHEINNRIQALKNTKNMNHDYTTLENILSQLNNRISALEENKKR